MVDEAPGADEGSLPLRQGTAHLHGTGPAEGDIAGGDDLHHGTPLLVAGRSGQTALPADNLLRPPPEAAHPHMLQIFPADGDGSPTALALYLARQILETRVKIWSASASVSPAKAARTISSLVPAASSQSSTPASVSATRTPR